MIFTIKVKEIINHLIIHIWHLAHRTKAAFLHGQTFLRISRKKR